MPLNEHVYCVAITFKMIEKVQQQISIKLCVQLEHSSMETVQMIQRLQLWATGDWQLYHDNVPPHASHLLHSVLVKYQITQVTQLSPDLVPCDFWLFPKLKSPLNGKRF